MLTELFDNAASPGTTTTLSQPLEAGDTTVYTNGPASTALQKPGQFRIIIINPVTNQMELALVTANADTPAWKVKRGIEGTSAKDFPQNSIVKHILTVEAIQSIRGARLDPVLNFGADPSGATDSTTAFNNASESGAVEIPAGTYLINGLLDIQSVQDFVGIGPGLVRFKLGPEGQIRYGEIDHGGFSGDVGNFTIDGQSVQDVPGGGFLVRGGGQTAFKNLHVEFCLGDNVVIERVQNCTFINFSSSWSGRSSAVFDNGCGGLRFYSGEFSGNCRYAVEIRQSKISDGGYPTWIGPSDLHFHGMIIEYPGADTLADYQTVFTGNNAVAPGMIYVAAGGDHSFVDCAINMQSMKQAGSHIIMVPGGFSDRPAVTANIIGWDGAAIITVDNVAGIEGLMSAKIPHIQLPTSVAGINGNQISLFAVPSASPIGAVATFGAITNDLTLDAETGFSGTQAHSIAFDLRGGTSVYMNGRVRFGQVDKAYVMTGADHVYVNGQPYYQSVNTIEPQQQSYDTGYFNPDDRVNMTVNNPIQITQRWPGAAFSVHDLADPYESLGIGKGNIVFSDGQSFPNNVQIIYQKLLTDAIDGASATEWLTVAGFCYGLSASILKANGLGGLTSKMRFFGQFEFVGPPGSQTWQTGDWGFDQNGAIWACIAGGAPGTWINPADAKSWEVKTINPFLWIIDPPEEVGALGFFVDTGVIGNGYIYNSSNTQHDEIGFDISLAKGTYSIGWMHVADNNRAIVHVMLDGVDEGNADQYASVTTKNAVQVVPGIVIPRSGKHRIAFKVETRNVNSSAWFMSFSMITIRRTA